MGFGQIIVGPPGSGKSTYCKVMMQFLKGIGRKVAVVNLDPANDILPYKCNIDVFELIKVDEVMDNIKLGPNGALMYSIEYLEKNIDWLLAKLKGLSETYVLFDCPGQVELYTHHNSMRNIFAQIIKNGNYFLCAVHLVDSHYCSEPSKFISVLLTSLAAMLQMELPQINVLSKVDLIEKNGSLLFNLEFFTEILDLSYLIDQFQDDPFFKKFRKLNKLLADLIEGYSLVSFLALHIEDKVTMLRVLKAADKANGYAFGNNEERDINSLLSCAVSAEFEYEKIGTIQEKFINNSNSNILIKKDSHNDDFDMI